MTSSPQTYLLNALVVYFDSIYALGNESILNVFKLIESSGLRGFMCINSLDIYTEELLSIYGSSSIDSDGKIFMKINDMSLSVDESFFASLFQLPTEGLISFSSIISEDMEDILKQCYA